MKGKKGQPKTELNDDLIDKKLQELGNKLKSVQVVEQRKSKNFFSELGDKSKSSKKGEKESSGQDFKWEVEAYPEKAKQTITKTENSKKPKIEEKVSYNPPVEKQSSPVERQTSPQQSSPSKLKQKKKTEPRTQSSNVKSPLSNNMRYLKYAILAIGLISCYLLLKKYQKLLFTFEKDYYDMLEIHATASSADIKAQFKKLAIKYHPDKNKDCGPICAIKFTEINSAYEVIGNEEKRKAYDSTQGTKYTDIPSKSQTLRAAQYNELVLQSEDFWVIEVYLDNNGQSNYLAQAWESVYDQLHSSIQMARINFRERDKFYWLNSMKLSEDNMPLVFSYYKHTGFTLASLDLNRGEISIKNFIRDTIPNHINVIRSNDVANMISSVKVTKQPTVLILSVQSRTPINVLALGLKLKGYIDVYVNAPDQPIQPIQKQLNDTKANVLVMYHDNEQLQYKYYTIPKNQEDSDLNIIIQPMLIISQPYIQLDNLETFCYNKLDIEQDIICILLNSKYATKAFLQEVKEHQMKQYIQNFDKVGFLPIQFGLIDLEDQQVLDSFFKIAKPNNTVKAFVIEAAQQKFQIYTQLEDVDALLDDINNQDWDYMNYYQAVELTNELFTNKYMSLFERLTSFISFKFKQDPFSFFVIIGLEVLIFYKIKNQQTKIGASVVLLLSYISYLL